MTRKDFNRIAHALQLARDFRITPLSGAELIGWNRSVWMIASELEQNYKNFDKQEFYRIAGYKE